MKGILLDDNFELSEFIKLGSFSSEEWTLYVLDKGLFLTGDQLESSQWKLNPFSLEGTDLICEGRTFKVNQLRKAKDLLEFVKLEESSEPLPETVYFLSEGKDLPADFIVKSLKLAVDRIFYAGISLKGESYNLLKVENPSLFLCQLCREEWGIQQFSLLNKQLIPLGFKHPLAEYLCVDQGWRIYNESGQWHELGIPEWQDVYKNLQISLDFEIDEHPLEESRPISVNVPVSIVPSLREEPAEVWVLEECQTAKLEKLIAQASEDEIENFFISSVRSGDENFFLIRSRNFNKSSLEFPGRALSRFSGFTNFMVPLDSTLNPPLRRDTYRSLFELKSSWLTLVFSQKGVWKKLVVEESSFEPLANFINFIVEAHSEAVKSMRSKVLFDPGIYLDAMPRPDLKIVRYEGGEKPVEIIEEEVFEEEEAVEEEVAEPVVAALADSVEQKDFYEDERESELERELVNEGQSFESWKNLMLTKKDLGKNYDALVCFFEALWLTDNENEQQLISNLPALLNNLNDKRPLTVTARALIPAEDLNAWLTESIDSLNRFEAELRIKELWLMWRSVLQVNKDSRHWVRLRENLRNNLNKFGLDLEESPTFIRNRIFLERCKMDQDDPDSAMDFKFATKNLEAVYEILTDKLPKAVKLSSRAVLANSSVHNLGNLQTARKWLDVHMDGETEDGTWFHLFADHCYRKSNSDIAAQHRQSLDKSLNALRKSAKSSIWDMDDYLESRETESAGSFLSVGNLKRLYPVNDDKMAHDVSEMLGKIKEARFLSEANWIREVIKQSENLPRIEEESSLARAVDIISTEIRSLKVSSDSKKLIEVYLNALLAVQARSSKLNNNFYRALTLSNCALGSAGVNSWDQSAEFLKDAFISLRSCSYPIDFIDCASVLLSTIEQMPLKLRAEPLKELSWRFCEMIRKHENMLNYGRLFPHVVRTVFHMSEAAAGREKISLNQFRNYLKSDEFLILHRLGQEEPV